MTLETDAKSGDVYASEDARPAAVWGPHPVSVIANEDVAYSKLFTVCTLVANDERYANMLESFARHGFDASNSEFLALDNRSGNKFDGFTWLRRILPEAKGEYIVFCHDDVELISDGCSELVSCLKRLTKQDASWTVAGNAGHRRGVFRSWASSRSYYLMSPGNMSDRQGLIPAEVESLDENFFVLNRKNQVVGSLDISGFHYYATDLVLASEAVGGRAYVIPFELAHHSWGNRSEEFYRSRRLFSKKHRRWNPGRTIITTTGSVWFGAVGFFENLLFPRYLSASAPRVQVEFDYRRGSLIARARRKAANLLNGVNHG